jgi:hypothetical protein
MKCPNCKTDLLESTEKIAYETMSDHVCDPNTDPPARTFFYCKNPNCALFESAFWDSYGDFYGKDHNADQWYENNSRYSFVSKTFNRKGASALNSFSREFEDGCIKRERYWWRRLRNRLHTRRGNFGVEIRRDYNPLLYDSDPNWPKSLTKWKYMIGVWIMDPLGRRYSKYISRHKSFPTTDITCLAQWRYHPYPWVRWIVGRYLDKVCIEHCFESRPYYGEPTYMICNNCFKIVEKK